METKIKTLYTLSIVAILAFLGMQAYWLYARYEYSLRECEDRVETVVADALAEYDKARSGKTMSGSEERTVTTYNMNHDVDSAGNTVRKVAVTTRTFQGRELLGIKEDRKLTPDELKQLEKMVLDSLDAVDEKRATLDVSSAPSDGVAWTAMRNFEREVHSPFTVEGIDSILKKDNIDADISLLLIDSLLWKPTVTRHTSVLSPRFKYVSHYSELEHKAVAIDCRIHSSQVIHEMGWTLVLAFILSLFLITCLVWQIKTIVRLTRLDNMRNMFVTTMIHELKRPISTLKMCVSGMDNVKMMSDPATRHELKSETRVALDTLSAYFSRLRDITFNNVEQIPLNVTTFNLSVLVGSVLKSISLPAAKKITLDNTVPRDMEMSADRSHMSNILTNLVENAIKYSRDSVNVKISATATHGNVTIRVTDNGNGIPSVDKSKIFSRFYRGKAYQTGIPGMGLGLTYVKLLVDAHAGEVSVMSTEGVGSTFTIKLPQ